jgi:hypothetical protein
MGCIALASFTHTHAAPHGHGSFRSRSDRPLAAGCRHRRVLAIWPMTSPPPGTPGAAMPTLQPALTLPMQWTHSIQAALLQRAGPYPRNRLLLADADSFAGPQILGVCWWRPGSGRPWGLHRIWRRIIERSACHTQPNQPMKRGDVLLESNPDPARMSI